MRVLLIPEDFRNDQYLLKPIFERLFRDLGRPSARIRVCQEPLLGGVAAALNSARLREVVEQHEAMVDIFILCVDRDGELGRSTRLDQIQAEFGPAFFAENAWEELETWTLAGLDLPGGWPWADVRAADRYQGALLRTLRNAQRGLADCAWRWPEGVRRGSVASA